MYKRQVKDVDAIIVRSDKVQEDVFEAAKNLKIVVRAGAGYDNVDIELSLIHILSKGHLRAQ